jgi:hypothetical protein
MSMNQTAVRQLSPQAFELDAAARYYVNHIERTHFDGRMPYSQAADLYRSSVASIASQRMLEEMEPIRNALKKTMLIMLRPRLEIPKELQDWLTKIERKWISAAEELIHERRSSPSTEPTKDPQSLDPA